MAIVGLRELRQDASGLLRRVERGEVITITVSGRPSAQLVPARAGRWNTWTDVQELFQGPADAEWTADRDLIDDTVADPWEPR